MPDVVVCIPTFRRPKSLARLLSEIEKLETRASVCVLVADNDPERHEGADLVSQRAAGYRFALRAIVVAERGIAQVRNALVTEALAATDAAFLAMIDDDEWPEPSWLDAFLRVQEKTGADALQGSILFAREDGRADRLANRDGVRSIRRATGPIDMLQGAGNLLLKRTSFERIAAPWFDPAFALSGGEDRDFFVRLSRAGCRFAWADEAIAHGDVPDARLSLSWILGRAYAVGNSDMRVVLKHWPGVSVVARECVKIAGAVLLAPVLLVILVPNPARRLDALSLLARAAGKAAAMLGHHASPYSVTHGE